MAGHTGGVTQGVAGGIPHGVGVVPGTGFAAHVGEDPACVGLLLNESTQPFLGPLFAGASRPSVATTTMMDEAPCEWASISLMVKPTASLREVLPRGSKGSMSLELTSAMGLATNGLSIWGVEHHQRQQIVHSRGVLFLQFLHEGVKAGQVLLPHSTHGAGPVLNVSHKGSGPGGRGAG